MDLFLFYLLCSFYSFINKQTDFKNQFYLLVNTLLYFIFTYAVNICWDMDVFVNDTTVLRHILPDRKYWLKRDIFWTEVSETQEKEAPEEPFFSTAAMF